MGLKIILIICLFTNIEPAFTQSAWELSRSQNGIKVYTLANPSSQVKSVRVETVLTGTLEKLSAILTDVKNNKNWVFNTRQSYLVKKVGAGDIVYYTETSLPWPLSNRDMVLRMTLKPDTVKSTLKVAVRSLPGVVSAKKGIVRIPHFNALWNVTYNGNNRITIYYLLHMDPGGYIPPAVINMFLTKGPFETFNNLARLLKQ